MSGWPGRDIHSHGARCRFARRNIISTYNVQGCLSVRVSAEKHTRDGVDIPWGRSRDVTGVLATLGKSSRDRVSCCDALRRGVSSVTVDDFALLTCCLDPRGLV